MTPDQIFAIIMLLTAFGVPPATVADIQAILTKANTTPIVMTTPNTVNIPPTTSASQPISPVAKAATLPILINTPRLGNTISHLFPEGMYGVVNLVVDKIVEQGGVDITDTQFVRYEIDEINGTPVDIHALDTTRFANGLHRLFVFADDGQGQSNKNSVSIRIKN